jgi:hypothetical protein
MIILFNGPPGSGKDAAADFFKESGFKHLSFKYQLYKETIKYFDVEEKWFMDGYKDRSEKEKPSFLLNHMSRREAMIHVSEQVIKPKQGLDYFGKQVANEINLTKNYAISDGGFIDELIPVINKVGAENFVLVQLVREGCSYSSDSRRYLDGNLYEQFILSYEIPIEKKYILPHKFDVKMYRIQNNGTLEAFYEVLNSIYEKEVYAREIKKEKQRKTC